jgi:hypothetical protein
MVPAKYIEDIFLEFADLVIWDRISYQPQDQAAIFSFQTVLTNGSPITKKQANYITKLLTKYQNQLQQQGIDISEELKTPQWRSVFRELDYSKALSLIQDESKTIFMVFKFPYAFKETFNKDFLENRPYAHSLWNKDLQAQTVKLHNLNIIETVEFCQKHGFEISQEILDLADEVGEIWSDEEDYFPHSIIDDGKVFLKNANENAENYFKEHFSLNLNHDMLLAKSMGFPVRNSGKNTPLEKICSTSETRFWVKDIESLVSLLGEADSWPAVVILDRTSDYRSWVVEFNRAYSEKNPGKNDIKVCFREANDDPDCRKFNQWIKDRELGGQITQGKIFVCNHKLPKWLIKDKITTKMLISNGLYPNTNVTTASYIDSHHTVLYVGNIKPSNKKDKKIVSL